MLQSRFTNTYGRLHVQGCGYGAMQLAYTQEAWRVSEYGDLRPVEGSLLEALEARGVK